MEEKKSGGLTTREIFEECRKYSAAERRAICEEFISDTETLAERIVDLFDVNPGVFMMFGVTVDVKITLFNDPAYEMKLGNPEFHDTVMTIEKDLKVEKSDDERA